MCLVSGEVARFCDLESVGAMKPTECIPGRQVHGPDGSIGEIITAIVPGCPHPRCIRVRFDGDIHQWHRPEDLVLAPHLFEHIEFPIVYGLVYDAYIEGYEDGYEDSWAAGDQQGADWAASDALKRLHAVQRGEGS